MLKFFRRQAIEEPQPLAAPRAPRHEVECSATLCADNAFHRARLCDVSRSGCKVRVAQPRRAGERVQIALEAHQSLGGTIRWYREGKAGIQFARPLSDTQLAMWKKALAVSREREANGPHWRRNFWGELVEGSDRRRLSPGHGSNNPKRA
jgi:hypothetical protein